LNIELAPLILRNPDSQAPHNDGFTLFEKEGVETSHMQEESIESGSTISCGRTQEPKVLNQAEAFKNTNFRLLQEKQTKKSPLALDKTNPSLSISSRVDKLSLNKILSCNTRQLLAGI